MSDMNNPLCIHYLTFALRAGNKPGNIPLTLDGSGAHLVQDSLHVPSRLLLASHRPSFAIASHLSSILGALAHPDNSKNTTVTN